MTPLKIGLPKGRLRKRSAQLERELISQGLDAEIYHLRIQDIPGLVSSGKLDAGVTGEEWIAESGAHVSSWLDVGWYSVRVSLIAKPGGFSLEETGAAVTVASEYPRLTDRYLRQNDLTKRVSVLTTHGSTESYVPSLASAAIDCVETGATLRSRGLIVMEDLMTCSVVLVGPPNQHAPAALLQAARATIGTYTLEPH